MNISSAEYYQKYPYIITLRKYWLEYDKDKDFPEYKDILSKDKIDSLYNVLKKNILLEGYISGRKWGESNMEKNYIESLLDKSSELLDAVVLA